MKNLNNVIRSRASRFVSLRVVLILSAVMVFAGFGAASAWNGEFQFLNLDETSAQTPDSPQVAAISNYAFTTATGVALEDMTGATTIVASAGDDTPSAVQVLGFDFFFMGTGYNGFCASPDGWMRLGSTTCSSQFSNSLTSTTNTPKIAPYWDDLATGTTGNVQFKVIGAPGSRKLIVQWFVTVPRNTAGAANATYQAWLFEGTGIIQYVYGAVPLGTDSYSVGLTATTGAFASITTSTDTNSFATANNAQTAAITAGKSYTYTPPQTPPADPTSLTFTNITASTVTLNWADNSVDEDGFPIYISSDGGTTYTLIGTAAENAIAANVSGLTAATTYFFRVYAVTEGVLSTGFAQNSVTTNPPIFGTKTIGPGGDYTTFAAAINDVNGGVIAGGVIFNVTAGTTFPENGTCITVNGTAANPVVFQKSGAGANPIIQPPGSAGTSDSGVCILGGDYITFNGIDVAVAGGVTTVEYGYLVSNSSATDGAQNNTIKNSKITLNRTNTSSIGIFHTLSVAATAASGANSNNRYYNITVENASRGILLNGTSASFPDSNNEIGVTGGGTTTIGAATANDIGNGTALAYGINAVNQNAVKISNTTVRNVTGTGTAAYSGIYLNNGSTGVFGTSLIYNNKISNISRITSTSSSGNVYGIRADMSTGNTATVYNNFITGLSVSNPTTATASIMLRALAANAGGNAGTVNTYFNSVRVDQGAALSYGSAAYYLAGGLTTTRNNIFSNFTGTQVAATSKHYAYYRSSGTITASSNNDLYIATGGGVGNGFTGFFTVDQATLANWATASGETASIAADPLFVSATDLHVAVASPVVDAGVAAGGITKDIDGQNRVGNPDIGADEPGGITPPANDIAATAITNPAQGSFFSTGATVTPTATFTNVGSADQTNVMVQFTITGPGPYNYTDTQTIASIDVDQTVTVTFATTPAFTTSGTYNMTAAVTTSDANAGNDSVMGTFQVIAPFGGSVNVGAGETYTSLTNPGGIFSGLNGAGATSNVTINITSDLAGETGTHALNEIAGGFTVLIKPSGAARTISGSAVTSLIRLDGADNVTIDGSLSGGTDKSLIISNTNAAGATIHFLNAATGNTVKNSDLRGVSTSTSNGVVFFSTVASGVIGNSTNTIQNNDIRGGATACVYGFYNSGTSTAKNANNLITGNRIFDFSTNGIRDDGNSAAATYSGNEIFEVTTQTTSLVGFRPSSTTIDSLTFTRNYIHDLNTTSTGSVYGIHLFDTNSAAAAVLIANNMITLSATAPLTLRGIYDQTATGEKYNLYANSIFLGGTVSGASTSEAYYWSIASTSDVRDNIFMNARTGGTGKHYAYRTNTTLANLTSDFNDIFNTGGTGNVFGNNGTADVADLPTWKMAPTTGTGKDANSRSIDPPFVSTTDLHLQGSTTLLGQGTLIASVNIDFDNDLRDSAPDIGADEISSSGRGGTIPPGTYRNGALGAAGLAGNTTFTGVLTLVGMVDANGFILTIDCDGTLTGGSSTSYVNNFMAGGGIKKNFCTAIPFAPEAVAFIFPVGAGTNYSPLDTNVTAATAGSSLTVKVDVGPTPSTPPLDANALQRYWTITEGGSVTADLLMHYADPNDVPTPGADANWRIFRVEGMTPTSFPNNCPGSPCVDFSDVGMSPNTLRFDGVFNFSKWTASAPLSPTNVTANVGGHVVDNTGAPLSGVTMTLLDTVLVENRTTLTDANGDYFFAAILTGRQIVVTPAKNGYTFDPQNRAFNHTGDLTNVDFVGTQSGQVRSVGSDFDGDGKADLSVFRPSDGTWYTVLSSTGVFKSQQWGVATDRIVPADYDGDHVTDIAVFRPSNGTWYISQSSTSTMRAVNWGLAEDVVTPADFDGDGQADIAVFRPSTGTWYIIDSHNGQTRTIQWGTTGDRPVAADYDGDGKDDVAVWRPSNGIWYVLKTDGTYTYEHWGIEEDRAVVGDYDGDNKADLAVFRPSTATWYVKLSSDGSINSRGHGTAADILTPADYDGDGKTDRAVWQTGGDWNILRSTTDTTFGQKWGMTGDIPTTSAYVR